MDLLIICVVSAVACAGLIRILHPLLVRYALARPNARSSHMAPTPQGGGVAVLSATIVVTAGYVALMYSVLQHLYGAADGLILGLLPAEIVLVGAAAIVLAVVGFLDDVNPLPVVPRLVLQACTVAVVVFAADTRLAPFVPVWMERGLVVVAGLWFVNLVNFMDGLDWITTAEVIPITAFVASLHLAGFFWPPLSGVVEIETAYAAAALCGAMLGFAPFNKPVAKLFLGDVGSLPIGLLLGWLLLRVASSGTIAAALLLPLYYLMDATITLLRRLARRERIWEAHRSHFYQQATKNGFSAMAVSVRVFALNLVLAGLAAAALIWRSWPVQVACLGAGVALVAILLFQFATPRPKPSP
jgi:UDP-N-acetylmuramyl pentapeptide phosphotransferase/UDP-N-acetylglucosamine-1-phosphate transferase